MILLITGSAMTQRPTSQPWYDEPGRGMTETQAARRRRCCSPSRARRLWWLLAGPLSAATMLPLQVSSGYGWRPLLPLVFLVLVTGFLGLQVKAARIHTSVELTPDYLRQGAETIRISEIVKIYPEADGAEVPTVAVGAGLGRVDRRPARQHRHRA